MNSLLNYSVINLCNLFISLYIQHQTQHRILSVYSQLFYLFQEPCAQEFHVLYGHGLWIIFIDVFTGEPQSIQIFSALLLSFLKSYPEIYQFILAHWNLHAKLVRLLVVKVAHVFPLAKLCHEYENFLRFFLDIRARLYDVFIRFNYFGFRQYCITAYGCSSLR